VLVPRPNLASAHLPSRQPNATTPAELTCARDPAVNQWPLFTPALASAAPAYDRWGSPSGLSTTSRSGRSSYGISGPLQSLGPCGLYGGRDPRPGGHRSATHSRPSRSTTGLWAGAERPRLDNSPLVGLLRRRRIGLGWGASRERGRGIRGRGGDRES
jgi:hypothetical protein